jgi:long-chain fatty acid transport protein
MTTPFRRTRIASAIAGIAFALGAGQVFAAGFALQETNGSGLGNAYAGGAAVAEDASTVWANPAGMSRFSTIQVAASLDLVRPSFKFSNSGSIAALTQPLGAEGGDAGFINFVPAMYVVVPINNAWAFGLGVNAPFGLANEYDADWMGRYQALNSEIKSININPSLSWKINESFSVGAGFSYQQIKATLTKAVNYSAAMASGYGQLAAAGQIPASSVPGLIAATGGLNSSLSLTGNDYAWGWNIGGMWNINQNNRVGAAYRSDITYKVNGNLEICNPAPNTATGYCGVLLPTVPSTIAPIVASVSAAVNSTRLYNGGVTLDLKLPGMANVSYFGTLNDRWDVMADAQWTHWSTFQYFTVVRTNGVVAESIPYLYKDVWRLSGGANYKYSDKWMFRGGVAWDQDPTPNADRTARLPGADRWWLSLGTQYKMDKNLKLDVGGTYVWVNNADIAQVSLDTASVAQNGYLKGSYNNSVWILGGQVSYSF